MTLYIVQIKNSNIITKHNIYKSLPNAIKKAQKVGGIVKDTSGNILYYSV